MFFFSFSLLTAIVTGFLGSVLLFAGEPISVVFWGAAVIATGSWTGQARQRRESGRSRLSLWNGAALGHPGGVPGWRRHRAKFLVRAAWQRRATERWLLRLSQPDARTIWSVRPRLASKLHRPYLRCGWGVSARLAALTSHYDSVRELMAPQAVETIYREGCTLMQLVSQASGRTINLRLMYRDQFEKEGEFTLAVEDAATGLMLAGVTFCLARESGRRVLWIGGVQASPDPRVRETIAAVAKELHGLRAKALAVWFLRQLCGPWHVTRLRAVSDAGHIYRHWRKRRAINAEYDEFWAECGGELQPDGCWELPLVVPPRPREEIKPSRRKMYERRYAMLASLQVELLNAYYTTLTLEHPPAAPKAFVY